MTPSSRRRNFFPFRGDRPSRCPASRRIACCSTGCARRPARRGPRKAARRAIAAPARSCCAGRATAALTYEPVNACILLLGQIDGAELLTVEDLAEGETLHPVQQAMVDYHGSQCGFCTPGIVMSLFAHYHVGDAATRDSVNEALAGNLCRCTGYRPIVDAALAVIDGAPHDRFAGARRRRGSPRWRRCRAAICSSATNAASSPRRRARRRWRRSTPSIPTRCCSAARPTSGSG